MIAESPQFSFSMPKSFVQHGKPLRLLVFFFLHCSSWSYMKQTNNQEQTKDSSMMEVTEEMRKVHSEASS